jgi:hypothetical protein
MTEADQAFRDYFAAEVPAKMPPLPLATPSAATASAPVGGRSFLLAACVAGLLGLGLWLAQRPGTRTQPEKGSLMKTSEADGSKFIDRIGEK